MSSSMPVSQQISKQHKAFLRKLYLAHLMDDDRHNLLSLNKLTGMPRRTLQDAIAAFEDIGIRVEFVQEGIAEYKKLLKAKARERDKVRKQQLKAKSRTVNDINDLDDADEAFDSQSQFTRATWVAIALLLLSWAGFAAYFFMT